MRRAYQNRVLTQFRKYYPDADTALDSATWEVMELFWNLDLSPVDQLMQDRYSVFGPQPRLPSDMLRSYLLSMKSKVPSLTSWASSLKQNDLYAILSGFMAAIRLVSGLLFIPEHVNGKPAPVIAWKKGSVTANAIVFTTA